MLEELIFRTLRDTLPESATDAAYLFAQTEDNQESVFAAAEALLQQEITGKICFIHTSAMSGYPGFKEWEEALLGRGIEKSKLEAVAPIPADTTILHTRIEAESMVTFAKQQGYKSMLVTAPPFHQPRAFMAAVTAALSLYPELKLYNYPGKVLPWQQEVTHSQGKVQDTRAGLIEGELKRIKKYQQQGELAEISQVLNYLNKRD